MNCIKLNAPLLSERACIKRQNMGPEATRSIIRKLGFDPYQPCKNCEQGKQIAKGATTMSEYKECKAEGCKREVHSKGYCGGHYYHMITKKKEKSEPRSHHKKKEVERVAKKKAAISAEPMVKLSHEDRVRIKDECDRQKKAALGIPSNKQKKIISADEDGIIIARDAVIPPRKDDDLAPSQAVVDGHAIAPGESPEERVANALAKEYRDGQIAQAKETLCGYLQRERSKLQDKLQMIEQQIENLDKIGGNE